MAVNTRMSDVAREKNRAVPLLIVSPACSLLLAVVLFLILKPLIPSQLARHMGPDGVGYSSTALTLTIMFAAATLIFSIGGTLARGFFRDSHWFPTQKAVVVCFVSLGYGVIGVALGTMFSTVGLEPAEVSGDSVGMGLLGFLLLFTAAACTYSALLPRAGQEPLPRGY